LRSGSEQKTETDRQLAVGTVRELYRDRLIERPQAEGLLLELGYDATEAGLVLAVADAQLAQRFLSAAVGRVRSRYTGWKIDRTAARDVLADLGIAGEQATDLLAIWDIERTANTATLTAAQVGAAFREGIIDQPTADGRLQRMGYTPGDAWLYLSQAANRQLPNPPADISVPKVEETAEVELLTAAQVGAAFGKELLTQAQALDRLAGMGYRPHEAWLYLSVRAGEPLPDEPPPD
jgi:hypothetical protein